MATLTDFYTFLPIEEGCILFFQKNKFQDCFNKTSVSRGAFIGLNISENLKNYKVFSPLS